MTTQAPQTLDHDRFQAAVKAARDRGAPMKLLRRTSFADYLEEIRPRLEALEPGESEPKVIPRIFEIRENPEALFGDFNAGN
jgi:hypothetical protein